MAKKAALITLIAILFLALSACSAAETQAPSEPAAGESASAEAAAATDGDEVDATEVVSQEDVPIAALPTDQTDTCLDCHTDKDTLMALAKPELKAEAESEGVG